MFYNQPLAIRFGTELLRHIDPVWDRLDIAVAWVRASGVVYLSDRFADFLRHGGTLSVIVGIDLENTTREGLQALLDLEHYGTCETFVYHNESNSIFHPKLYLWRNEKEARLIVASNNITESGLYVNVEAGLQIDVAADDPVVIQTLDALSSWKSHEGGLAKRLDAALLAQLVAGDYVPNEAAVRASIAQRRTRRAQTTVTIFGKKRFLPPAPPVVSPAVPGPSPARPLPATAPAAPISAAATANATSTGTALLMRLRVARRTQTQIPFRLSNTFFQGVTSVLSAHDGRSHNISTATAGGKPNTVKLDIPELEKFGNPVARFERTPTGITYETYDIGSPQGNQILRSLQAGQHDGTTQQSISDPRTSTWWRFI